MIFPWFRKCRLLEQTLSIFQITCVTIFVLLCFTALQLCQKKAGVVSPSSSKHSSLAVMSNIYRKNDAQNSPAAPMNACKKLHIALIVATPDEARTASFLLKTLFYHRRFSLHLHFLVTAITHQIMKTLMETWELREVTFMFYEVANTNDDRSGSWETLKFRIPHFISSSIAQRVVYFHNDMRFLDDVSVLWGHIENEERGAIGLVTCDDIQERWCFDDHIVAFDLEKFQHSPLRTSLMKAKTKTEVDALLSQNRKDLIFNIPCNWAISLNEIPVRSTCVEKLASVKALIQTDIEAEYVNHPVLELAREHTMAVLNSEPPTIMPLECSTGFRQHISGSVAFNLLSLSVREKCVMYKDQAFLKRRTHLYYLGYSNTIIKGKKSQDSSNEITLIIQLTLDRFSVLERVLVNWNGPASVLFYLTDADATTLSQKVKESIALKDKQLVTYHVVYKRQIYHPVNYLRNVLLNNIHTPYVLFLDVDFIPNPNLYANLKVLVRRYMQKKDTKQLLVIPAFQMFTDLENATPVNKAELLPFLANQTIFGFGMNSKWKFGHQPTDYDRWVNADEPYQAQYANFYEPYFVVRKDFDTRYNELLLDRMGNKNAYARLLHGQGFKFLVIPQDFIIHFPHPKSFGLTRYESKKTFSYCAMRFRKAYELELYKRFPNRTF